MAGKHRVLIVISGGLVQEIYTTDPEAADILLIDWDNIKEGDITASPWVDYGSTRVAGGQIDEMLKEAEEEHARLRMCEYCGRAMVKDGEIIHDESKCPKRHWRQNDIQFPRLLAAISEVGLTESQVMALGQSTDLDSEQIGELLGRAEKTFEQWENKVKPRGSNAR